MLSAHDMGQERVLVNTGFDVVLRRNVEETLTCTAAISFRNTCSNLVYGIS